MIRYCLQLILLFLVSCATFEITEQDVFENHTTITPELFDYEQFVLHIEEVETEDGESINSWFLEREDARATVIYFGGNAYLMVKASPLIEAYSDIPVNLVLFDYRGYGRSSGTPSIEGVKLDAAAIYNHTVNRYKNESNHPVYAHGQSMGTFMSAYIAYEFGVSGYILENPITNVKNWSRKMTPWILRPFIRFDFEMAIEAQNNLGRAASTDVPLLIFTGSNDMITPSWMAEELYEASASDQKDIVKIAGGTHNDLPTFTIYQMRLREFLSGENDNITQ